MTKKILVFLLCCVISMLNPLSIMAETPTASLPASVNSTVVQDDGSFDSTVPLVQPFVPDDGYLLDRERLETLQQDAFRYMWDGGHPDSGMVFEAIPGWENSPVAVGGTGFGVAAMVCAVDRGWLLREQALERLLKIVLFLRDKSSRKALHGAFPHWLHGSTGETIAFGNDDTGADIVETAVLMQGLLIARAYFNGPGIETELRAIITELWEDIDWNWFTNDEDNGIYWHWDKTRGFSKGLKILGYNECMIAYVLAISSPTHPISRRAYDYWTSGKGYQPKNVFGYRVEASLAGAGPLFLAHYSFIGLDPRRMADDFVTQGYFVRNVKHTLSNRSYCLYSAPLKNKYTENYWGLTASKVKGGYAASEPNADNATVAPTASLTSMPYTPHYSMQVLEALTGEYKQGMWGPYGPYDAFNLRKRWYSREYLAIDQLPIVCMVENYRSGLLWRLFMGDQDIREGLLAAGIREPELEQGFPEAVVAVKRKGKRYIEDAYDVRRHSDTGVYNVPYWTDSAQPVTFMIMSSNGDILMQRKENARQGRNVMRFPQFMPPDQAILKLIMRTAEGEEYELPVRLH